MSQGRHEVEWRPAEVFFDRLRAGDSQSVGKTLLLR
jgi:hypothetical protein